MIRVLFKTRSSGDESEPAVTTTFERPWNYPSLSKLCEALSGDRTPETPGLFIIAAGDHWDEGRWSIVIRDEPNEIDGAVTIYGIEEIK